MQTEWLKVMLEEIARKREESDRAREEAARRATESGAAAVAPKRRPGSGRGRR